MLEKTLESPLDCKEIKSVIPAAAKSLQLCPTLCDPIDVSLPGSSVLGILQARILEWVVISSLRGSSQVSNLESNPCLLCLLHWQAGSLPPVAHGKPHVSTLDPNV